MRGVSAVVLAAGKSTRMGGPNKLLLPWHGTTVVGAVVGALRGCDVEIVVVTGRDSEQVAQAVAPSRTVFNEQYEQGMGTSIAAGVKACPEDNAILIVLGDMPALDPNVVQQLISALETPSDIIAPVYKDEPTRPGHPVLFGADYRGALSELKGDNGAKAVIDSNNQNLKRIDCKGTLSDIDSARDL